MMQLCYCLCCQLKPEQQRPLFCEQQGGITEQHSQPLSRLHDVGYRLTLYVAKWDPFCYKMKKLNNFWAGPGLKSYKIGICGLICVSLRFLNVKKF